MTGAGRYVADLCDDETLHCWFVRSPVAHGLISNVDTEAAVGLPGVVAIYTADDLEMNDIPGNTGRGPEARDMTRPPLARTRVRYSGEPVAVAVAQSPAVAEDAAGMVWVDVDDLPPVVDVHQAMAGESLLFPEAGTNVVAHSSLEHGEVSSSADLFVTIETSNQRLAPMSIEPPAILVRPFRETIEVWCSHQAPHRLKAQLGRFLGLDPETIRVITPDVGGAFGMKGMLFPEYLIVTRLATILRRSVAWVATRRENVLTGTHGRGQRHRLTLRGSPEGDIQEMNVEIMAEVGAYPHNGSQIPMFTAFMAQGLYDFPRVTIDTRTFVTNLAPIGSYRGAGRPEAAYAIERAMDEFARAAGLDPFEVRRRNLIKPDRLPFRTATGALYDTGNYPAALEKAYELLDVDRLRSEQIGRLEEGLDPIGIGVAAFVERAGGAVDSGEYGLVEIDPERRGVLVRTGSTEQGQGHATIWAAVASNALGLDSVEIISGDTGEVDQGVGTFASRSVQTGAAAVFRTAGRVFAEARKRAAESLEAAEEDLVYESGIFSVVGSPGIEVDIFELAREEPLMAEEMFVPGAQTFPYGVHGAVVEVSLETGAVTIRRIVAVDDCGVVMDKGLVQGQLQGSLIQGLGQARFEAIRYDDSGQLQTTSFMDYLIPTAVSVPPIDSARLEHPAPSNPLGAKGAGEAGCIGLPPAILNATIDALSPYGVTDLQMPLTQDRVWTALQRARGEHPERSPAVSG